jgi:membrane protein
VYGPLAAPIALLLWLYVVSLAVLIGAAFNAAITRTGRHHGESEREASDI